MQRTRTDSAAPPAARNRDLTVEEETTEQRRSRRAAIIWLICFVGGVYLVATVMGLWLWFSGRLSF